MRMKTLSVKTFLFISVLTKSGPMGEWRRAKTEVSEKSNQLNLISQTGSK